MLKEKIVLGIELLFARQCVNEWEILFSFLWTKCRFLIHTDSQKSQVKWDLSVCITEKFTGYRIVRSKYENKEKIFVYSNQYNIWSDYITDSEYFLFAQSIRERLGAKHPNNTISRLF